VDTNVRQNIGISCVCGGFAALGGDEIGVWIFLWMMVYLLFGWIFMGCEALGAGVGDGFFKNSGWRRIDEVVLACGVGRGIV
jgi:hypothetical protein